MLDIVQNEKKLVWVFFLISFMNIFFFFFFKFKSLLVVPCEIRDLISLTRRD